MRIIIINVKKKRKENETKCCVQPGAADGTRLSEIHFTFCVYAPDVTHTHIYNDVKQDKVYIYRSWYIYV